MIEREKIYVFSKRDLKLIKIKPSVFKNLKKRFVVKIFYSFTKFLETFLFSPPSLVIFYYEYERSREIFEKLSTLKKEFNLFFIPFILLVRDLKPEILLTEAEMADDFVTLESIEEVPVRVEYALKRIKRLSDNNPLTGLPGNTSITKALESVLKTSKELAVAYIDIDNFKAYNDAYGFSQGDELIKNLARILSSTLIELSPKEHFLGHVGGDDFVFIVPFSKVEEVAKEIIKRFDSTVPLFLKKEDIERGYFVSKDRKGNITQIPLPSISIAIVPVIQGKFKHIGEISQRAAEVKGVVKKMPGSNYFIDRRK